MYKDLFRTRIDRKTELSKIMQHEKLAVTFPKIRRILLLQRASAVLPVTLEVSGYEKVLILRLYEAGSVVVSKALHTFIVTAPFVKTSIGKKNMF